MSTLQQKSPGKYGDRWQAVTIPSTRRHRNASTFSFNEFSRKSSTGRSHGRRPHHTNVTIQLTTHRADEQATYDLEIARITSFIDRLACRGLLRILQPGDRYSVSGSPSPPDEVGDNQVQRS